MAASVSKATSRFCISLSFCIFFFRKFLIFIVFYINLLSICIVYSIYTVLINCILRCFHYTDAMPDADLFTVCFV